MRCPSCNHEFDPPKRGTRLSADWQPDDVLFKWAVAHRSKLGVIDVPEQIESFRDYWTAKAGKDGTKLDWDATFRNWIRSARVPYRALPLRAEPNGRKANPPADQTRRMPPEKRAANLARLGDLLGSMAVKS